MTIVRDAVAAELLALAARVADQDLLRRYGIAADKLGRDLVAALERGEPILVVEDDGVASGFAWWLPKGGLGLGAYLRLIVIEPGHEGRGLGAALMDELERRAATFGKNFFLLVSAHNTGARRFYAARGYREVGTLPSLVKPDIDEVLCHKRLTEG
jgi:ribosomal protein S18 acetylase RimI-like enzyme